MRSTEGMNNSGMDSAIVQCAEKSTMNKKQTQREQKSFKGMDLQQKTS